MAREIRKETETTMRHARRIETKMRKERGRDKFWVSAGEQEGLPLTFE